MEKDHLNDKVLDKEKALSVIKTSYLNSYKISKRELLPAPFFPTIQPTVILGDL